jgi:hypothetical protein
MICVVGEIRGLEAAAVVDIGLNSIGDKEIRS